MMEASYNPTDPRFSRIFAETLLTWYLEQASDLQAMQHDRTQAIVLTVSRDQRFEAMLELGAS